MIDVGDQERQRIVDAIQVFTGETALHVGVGAHAHEDGIILVHQLLHGHVLAHFGVQTELDAHLGEHFAATAHHALFELELRDTEGQQTTDLRIAIEHHRLDAVAHQNVRTTQARRAGTDDRHLLVGPDHLGHVRLPAHGESGVGDVFLHRADCHGAEAVVQRTGTFTQTVLRADTAAHFRQGVGLMAQLHRFHDVAFGDQLQPVGDEVVYRALPFTVGVAALQAAVCLRGRILGFELFIDLGKLLFAHVRRDFFRSLTANIDKLEIVFQTVSHVTTSSGTRPLGECCC